MGLWTGSLTELFKLWISTTAPRCEFTLVLLNQRWFVLAQHILTLTMTSARSQKFTIIRVRCARIERFSIHIRSSSKSIFTQHHGDLTQISRLVAQQLVLITNNSHSAPSGIRIEDFWRSEFARGRAWYFCEAAGLRRACSTFLATSGGRPTSRGENYIFNDLKLNS